MGAEQQYPFAGAFAIVPSDTVALSPAVRGIYVGGAGDVNCTFVSGQTAVTFKAPPVGTVLNISPLRVNATLTTATLLIGLT